MKAKLALGLLIAVIASYTLLNMSDDAIAAESDDNSVFAIKDVKKGEGNNIHDFSFTDENGDEKYLSEITEGKVVFLNFWGTWCPPCRKEIPAIIKLQKEYKDDMMVIGIALENGKADANIKKVANYADKSNINYMNFIETQKREYGTLFGGIPAVPTTFIVNKKGEVVERVQGGMEYAQFKQLVSKYL